MNKTLAIRFLMVIAAALLLPGCAHQRQATTPTTSTPGPNGMLVTTSFATVTGQPEIWRLTPAKGADYTLTLAPDGLATSSHGHHGLWSRTEAGTHIKWSSGAYVWLGGGTYAAYANDYGQSGSIPPVETGSATRRQP